MPITPKDLLHSLEGFYHPHLQAFQDLNQQDGPQLHHLEDFIDYLKAMDRKIGDSFSYLLDAKTNQYHFLSENVEPIMGFSVAELKAGGVAGVFALMEEADRDLYNKFFLIAPSFYHDPQYLNRERRISTTITYRINTKHQGYIWLKQSSYQFIGEGNNTLLDYGIVTLCTKPEEQRYGFTFYLHDADGVHVIGHFDGTVTPLHDAKLSKRELEVLEQYTKGHSAEVIADLLHLSIQTIYQHRKSICKKLGVERIQMAVALYRQGVR